MAFAEKHFKPNGPINDIAAPFQLFYNDTMQNNIFLLMEHETRREVYTVLNTPNYIKTSDPKMTDYINNQIQRILERSVPLGKSGEKYRNIYFRKLKNKYRKYHEQIMRLLEHNHKLVH